MTVTTAKLLGPGYRFVSRRFFSGHVATAATEPSSFESQLNDTLRLLSLAREFRTRGHLYARLDPLQRCEGGPYWGEGRLQDQQRREEELRGSTFSFDPSDPPEATVEDQAQRHRRHFSTSASPSTSYSASLGPVDLSLVVASYPWSAARSARNGYLMASLGLRSEALDPAALAASSAAFLEGGRLPAVPSPGEPCDLFETLHSLYCGPIAWEYRHCTTEEERRWWAGRVERPFEPTVPERRWLLQRLLRAEVLEDVLGALFPASKRFGLEGCESLIPGVESLVRRSAAHSVMRIEMGMAHRGRINFLCNVLGKPFGQITAQMKGDFNEFHVGDVIYHGRYENQKYEFTPFEAEEKGLAKGRPMLDHVYLSVAPNPSHLEAVGPVVQGMVRALQEEIEEAHVTDASGKERSARAAILPVLFHGDAAFSGQGVVAETLNLSRLNAYDVGGTVHIVINNQVGFTTDPFEARSTAHCTDVAKGFGIPIVHVNADHPDAVLRAFRMAADYRAKFQRDVLVDLVGYRRQGHNELDNARATQPLSQARIDAHPRVTAQYSALLVQEGAVTAQEVEEWRAAVQAELKAGYEAALRGEYHVKAEDFIAASWQGEALASLAADTSGKVGQGTNPIQEPTGLPIPTLQWVGRRITELPPGFTPDPSIAKVIEDRRRMIQAPDARVDWAMAEQLALAALALHQGFQPPGLLAEDDDGASGLNRGHYKIRLTGQDSERGTFSQRHAVVHDTATGAVYSPLQNMMPEAQEPVDIRNSPLSEEATLGFEYGFSLGVRKKGLVLWEAQFGDFANEAQVVIDQFISSGESKWGQESGLVLLLPHGYDGQGPDHSSARMERFLQMVSDDPDHLPGQSPQQRSLIKRTFQSLAGDPGQGVRLEDVLRVIDQATAGSNGGEGGSARAQELASVLWIELGLSPDAKLDLPTWRKFMVSYLRRNAERTTNLFVVNASTPAQYFHVLRRQVNLPYSKPLILFTPKKLLHHRPCTSALSDFGKSCFFNRVIDDGKESDNTRHLAVNPATGQKYLLPPERIRRVIISTGQIYYQLSAARRLKRIRDIVLVRLEQIAPFPHDRLIEVLNRYPNAEVVWVQEEPKNMGAFEYVRPRLTTALKEEYEQATAGSSQGAGAGPRSVRYIGRPVSAATATASMSISLKETKDIVEFALAAVTP